MGVRRSIWGLALAVLLLAGGCDVVPPEAVELSNTVGRDLEEVHRAHRALAEVHFSGIESDVNTFIDQQYRPAYIRTFAAEFRLGERVAEIADRDPAKLLPVMTRFVEVAVRDIEAKRAELLAPIRQQKTQIIADIDRAHRQIQAAQAVVTGHLASVRKVREVQTELLAEVGLGDLRERIATRTASISDRIQGLVETGQEVTAGLETAEATIESARDRVDALDRKIDEVKDAIATLAQEEDRP